MHGRTQARRFLNRVPGVRLTPGPPTLATTYAIASVWPFGDLVHVWFTGHASDTLSPLRNGLGFTIHEVLRHLRVDRRGCEVGVAEEFLQRRERAPVREPVHSVRVSRTVNVEALDVGHATNGPREAAGVVVRERDESANATLRFREEFHGEREHGALGRTSCAR